ncbi:MAG: hypothetical protein EXR73_14010 [Myxococcales bacterium]|nr:hypothetical protein [Myxococcales bacterium]
MDKSIKVACGLTGAALVVNFLGSFWSGSMLGALLALGGTGAAAFGSWRGTQQKGQGQAAFGVTMIVVSLGVATLLAGLKLFSWVNPFD